jgi:hypothetical protein
MDVNSVNMGATTPVMNGGTLYGMQGMFGVYQKAPIDGECYLTKNGRAIALVWWSRKIPLQERPYYTVSSSTHGYIAHE